MAASTAGAGPSTLESVVDLEDRRRRPMQRITVAASDTHGSTAAPASARHGLTRGDGASRYWSGFGVSVPEMSAAPRPVSVLLPEVRSTAALA